MEDKEVKIKVKPVVAFAAYTSSLIAVIVGSAIAWLLLAPAIALGIKYFNWLQALIN